LVGKPASTPALVPHLKPGDKVEFERDHIIDTWDEYLEKYRESGRQSSVMSKILLITFATSASTVVTIRAP
jgi:hypothetical protein